MTINLIIGNCISLIAAYFTAKSSWAKDIWHIYFYQVVQCLLLAAASVFFQSYAGIISLLACALRNYLAATGRLTKQMTLFCLFIILVPGILVNNRGAVGWLVIAANVIYTIGVFLAKKETAIKWNILLNLTLWMVYEILIVDIPSAAADAVGWAAAAASLVRAGRQEQTKKTV